MKKIFLYLITGAAIGVASCSNNNTNLSDPDPVENPATDTVSGQSIRVMAYNIHHANPPSKPELIDIDAIVQAIRAQDPDLVALQEIDVHTERSGAFNQAEEIAKKLDMHYFFGKAIDYGGGGYGVAILSKHPMSEEVVHRLPTKAETNGEPRILATAKITLPDGSTLRFGSTHLDAQREPVNRELQIAEIGKIAAKEKLPFIIAGDFNATPDSEVIRQLDTHFKRTCQLCTPTIPVIDPTKAIDFIAYKPADKFKIISHEVVPERYASDHLPIVAEIEYLP